MQVAFLFAVKGRSEDDSSAFAVWSLLLPRQYRMRVMERIEEEDQKWQYQILSNSNL